MNMPGMRFHLLKGGRFSVWVDENYRVTFTFENGHAYEVGYEDIESSGRMHSPAHPGEILKEMYIAPLGVTVTKVAEALGVTRKHVSAIVNGRAPATPDDGGKARGGLRH
jgi:hypothetical protein